MRILNVRPYNNPSGTMVAFVDIETPSGMQINGTKLMRGSRGGYWLAMPAQQRRDDDGNPLSINDKKVFDEVVSFRDSATRNKFRDQVIDVLRQSHPQLFNDQSTKRPADDDSPW
jgi:DNA-binding cell septation regulator SpoVG